MKNPGHRHDGAPAAFVPAAAGTVRQLGGTLSRRTGVGGLRLRHAMTILSILTIAMATSMIIMAATTSKETDAVRNHRHADDSPLAHALSSSRRRNLSQLLPEEETMKERRMEETSRKMGKDDDETQIRTLLRQQKELKKMNVGIQVTSDSEAKPNGAGNVVNDVGTNQFPNNGENGSVGGQPPVVKVLSDTQEQVAANNHYRVQAETEESKVIELHQDGSVEESAIVANSTETDEIDPKVVKGLGNMLDKLQAGNKAMESGKISIINTDPVLAAKSQEIHARLPHQSIYARNALGGLTQSTQQLEIQVQPVDKALANNRQPRDPLMANISDLNLTTLDIHPKVPHLGVLLDAGRHYFPIPWIKNMMRYLHAMNFNFIHFRLTDDQTFNINLTSYPQLASPVTYNNPEHLVYSKDELRDLVELAKSLNITIMPEINIPGHAGSWAGIPGLIVNCPEFICQKGYGVPINVTHPDLKKILTSIIQEVREVFYTSPYLHLGGDEVHMARPCFEELGEELFDYGPFENMLKDVLKDLNISNDMVLRWEMTGQQLQGRAGNMIHFWESDPGHRMNATGPYFISNGLYFDTNGGDRAYEVYEKSIRHLQSSWSPDLKAIVVGTFELNDDFWFQRNIIGRLIGVAMGASGRVYDNMTNFAADYNRYCSQLQIDEMVCALEGAPVAEQHVYYGNWQGAWAVWKNGICDRLTYPIQVRSMMPVYNWRQQMLEQVNREFWNHFAREPRLDSNGTAIRVRSKPLPYDFTKITVPDELAPIRKHAIQHTGVILDLVNSHPGTRQLEEIINQLTFLGFNLIQLRLADDFGYAMAIPISQGNRLEYRSGRFGTSLSYDHVELAQIVDYAERQGGIEVMPEISISTNTGGWFKVGFGLACPNVICNEGRGIANDITESELLPVVSSIIRDLRKIFSSELLHLGADERQQSVACFNESRKRTSFNVFERKLTALLEMEGVNVHNVLRWENQEHKRYRGRAGKITHFRVLQNSTIAQHHRPDKGEIFFANVDIFDGSAWDIYQRTRELVSFNPKGLMAEIRLLLAWSDRKTFGRLLAFVMGLATALPEWSSKEYFRGNFTHYCQAMVGKLDTIENEDCVWFEVDPENWEVEVETDTSRAQSCNAQTYMVTKRLVRTNITAY